MIHFPVFPTEREDTKVKPLKAPLNLGRLIGGSARKLDVPRKVFEVWGR